MKFKKLFMKIQHILFFQDDKPFEKRFESFDLFDSFELCDPKHNFALISIFSLETKFQETIQKLLHLV